MLAYYAGIVCQHTPLLRCWVATCERTQHESCFLLCTYHVSKQIFEPVCCSDVRKVYFLAAMRWNHIPHVRIVIAWLQHQCETCAILNYGTLQKGECQPFYKSDQNINLIDLPFDTWDILSWKYTHTWDGSVQVGVAEQLEQRGKLGLTGTHAPNLAFKSSFWHNIGAKDILRGWHKGQECRWQDLWPGCPLS